MTRAATPTTVQGMDPLTLLEGALERVVERVGDPAPRVYERLFEAEPGLRAMFVLDTQGAARGEMFHRAIETVLALAGGQAYAAAMIQAEWSNHRMTGVSKAQFDGFFDAMGEAFRETLGADWSADIDRAWRDTVARIGRLTDSRAAAS